MCNRPHSYPHYQIRCIALYLTGFIQHVPCSVRVVHVWRVLSMGYFYFSPFGFETLRVFSVFLDTCHFFKSTMLYSHIYQRYHSPICPQAFEWILKGSLESQETHLLQQMVKYFLPLLPLPVKHVDLGIKLGCAMQAPRWAGSYQQRPHGHFLWCHFVSHGATAHCSITVGIIVCSMSFRSEVDAEKTLILCHGEEGT